MRGFKHEDREGGEEHEDHVFEFFKIFVLFVLKNQVAYPDGACLFDGIGMGGDLSEIRVRLKGVQPHFRRQKRHFSILRISSQLRHDICILSYEPRQ